MRWIQYPDEHSRKARLNGIPREGQIWSDAPGVRCKWVVPGDGRTARRSSFSNGFALVRVYENAPESNYALDDDPGAALRAKA
jgi:hypothetical protein